MFRSPQIAANLKIATQVILLQEARNVQKAMFLLLMKSDKRVEAMGEFGHLGTQISGTLKTGTNT